MDPVDKPRGRGRPLVLAATAYSVGALMDGDRLADNLITTALFIGLALVFARARRISAILFVLPGFFFAGVVTGELRLPPSETMSTLATADFAGPRLLEGIIREAPELRVDRTRVTLDLVGTATAVGMALTPVHGRLRVTVGAPNAPCGRPGDRVRLWATAHPIRANDFPGGIPRRALAARRGISLEGFSRGEDHCIRIAEANVSDVRLAMERLRAALHDAVGRSLPAERAAVTRAFATGDTSGIDPTINDAFIRSGLSHLLAVSGLNLAIISGLFVIALAFVLKRIRSVSLGVGVRAASAGIAVPFVILYTLLVGASPSAVRAASMVLALLVARMFGRVAEAWSALALALIVMVAWDPATLGDVSFQLSFAAVVALLRIYPALRHAARIGQWSKWLRPVGDVALASLAATIGTAPLVARHFNRLSLAGLVANIPAAPLSSFILVPLSLVGGLIGTVNDTLASPILWVAGQAAGALVWIAQTAAAMPAASIVLPTPTIPESILFYGAVIGLARVPFKRSSALLGGVCGALMVASIVGTFAARRLSTDVSLTFLPVGHGDAVLAELPGGEVMLIDTGPPGYGLDSAQRVILPFLLRRRITRIDTVVITHADADHAGSLPSLLEHIEVGEIWINGDDRKAIDGLAGHTVRVVSAATPPIVEGPLEIRVLAPVGDPSTYESENDASIVLRLEIGDRRILLTGDIEADAEARLLAAGVDLKADVLKAPHHGSRTSSTDEFLTTVAPSDVIFTVSKNDRFGHPHAEIIDRYRARHIAIWRTDEDGAVHVWTNGKALEVSGYVVSTDHWR